MFEHNCVTDSTAISCPLVCSLSKPGWHWVILRRPKQVCCVLDSCCCVFGCSVLAQLCCCCILQSLESQKHLSPSACLLGRLQMLNCQHAYDPALKAYSWCCCLDTFRPLTTAVSVLHPQSMLLLLQGLNWHMYPLCTASSQQRPILWHRLLSCRHGMPTINIQCPFPLCRVSVPCQYVTTPSSTAGQVTELTPSTTVVLFQTVAC